MPSLSESGLLPRELDAELVIRPAHADEKPFVLDTWVRSFRRHAPEMNGPIYDYGQRRLAARLMERGSVLVAAGVTDAAQLFGHIVYEKPRPDGLLVVVHYVYVKRVFRRFRIGTMLLEAAGAGPDAHYTHRTSAGTSLAARWGGHFNPYLGGVL